MASVMKRRLEKRLETGLWLSAFMASALTDAGIYCARLVLTNEDHGKSTPADRLKRIPIVRAEICQNEGEGAEMRIAATSAIEQYMSTHTLETGWFVNACKAGMSAARDVFCAGYSEQFEPDREPSFEDTHYGMSPQEYRNWKRRRAGIPAPELHDEERRYRTRSEGKFYVNDAVVPAAGSSINSIKTPEHKNNCGEHAQNLAFKAILRAEKKRGARFANKLNEMFSELKREGNFAAMIELAYTV